MDEEEKKKRREQYRIYATSDAGRASQHARQKAYHERRKKAGTEYYHINISLQPQFKEIVSALCEAEGKRVGELFIAAFEEKYGVTIHKEDTNT